MRMRGVLAIEPRNPAAAGRAGAAPPARHLRLAAGDLAGAHPLRRCGAVHDGADGVGAAAQLAAGGHLARPAHAAGGARRAGRHAGADRAAAGRHSRREIAQSMREAALRMNSLVNNLLDMARLEAGAVQLNRQWQPLEEVVGSALAVPCAGTLRRRRVCVIDLRRRPAAGASRCRADRARAVQPAGERRQVHAAGYADRRSTRACHERSVVLRVDDHGPGLPTRPRGGDLREVRARHARKAPRPASAWAWRSAVRSSQAHGGTITGATRPGGGARFTCDCRAANRRTMMAAQLD